MVRKVLNKYNGLSIVTKASLWAFVANMVQRGATIIATPIFTRILTTEEYAQYTLYQSWHDIFIIFASLNVFNYAAYTGLTKYDKDKNGFIATAQTVVTLLTFSCCGLYFVVNLFFKGAIGFSLPIVILMFFDILFFASFNLWTAKERYDFRYKMSTVVSVLMGALGPALGFVAIQFSSNRGYGRIYGVAIVNIVIGFGVYLYNYIKSKNRFDKCYVKFIFAYCLPLIPHFLSSQVLTRFDRIMINDMCGASETGIYSLAYSLSSLMLLVNDAILKSLTPLTYKSIKENSELDSLKKNTMFITIFVALSNFVLILFAPEIVKIFAPAEYYEAVYIIPAVSGSIYLMFLFNLFANIEYYYSQTKYVAAASFLAAVVNIVLNFIFIEKYGYIAAGYTTLVSYILYAFGHYVFMKKVTKKYADSKNYYNNFAILMVSAVFIILSLVTVLIYNEIVVRYLIILTILVGGFLKRKTLISYFKKV